MTAPVTELDWNAYVTQIANMAVVLTTTTSGQIVGQDAAFNLLLPQAVGYAENRIQRDLDLLPAQERQTYTLTIGSNILNVPVDDFVVIRTLNIESGTATYPCLPVTQEWLRNVYGDSDASYRCIPLYFAMYGGDVATAGTTSNVIALGPYPDMAYTASVVGMVRLPSLYTFANPSDCTGKYTFISTWYPDLLIQASLVYVAQFQRNFGLTGNDPQMPGAYEAQYQTLLRGAMSDEGRKRFQASAWSSQPTPANATPTR